MPHLRCRGVEFYVYVARQGQALAKSHCAKLVGVISRHDAAAFVVERLLKRDVAIEPCHAGQCALGAQLDRPGHGAVEAQRAFAYYGTPGEIKVDVDGGSALLRLPQLHVAGQ